MPHNSATQWNSPITEARHERVAKLLPSLSASLCHRVWPVGILGRVVCGMKSKCKRLPPDAPRGWAPCRSNTIIKMVIAVFWVITHVCEWWCGMVCSLVLGERGNHNWRECNKIFYLGPGFAAIWSGINAWHWHTHEFYFLTDKNRELIQVLGPGCSNHSVAKTLGPQIVSVCLFPIISARYGIIIMNSKW